MPISIETDASPIITYLLGAGASRYAPPIIEDIPLELDRFLTLLKRSEYLLPDDKNFEGLSKSESKRDIQNDLIDTLGWMLKGAEKHSSIDVFAKKVYSSSSNLDSFNKLKAGLSIFFAYLHAKNPVDRRYDTFIAALVDGARRTNNMPKNLKILTWNYDFQFEKSYSAFIGSNALIDSQISLNVEPSDNFGSSNLQQFQIFKLNGTTGMWHVRSESLGNVFEDLDQGVDLSLFDRLVEFYAFCSRHPKHFRSLLTFAWEETEISKNVISKAIDATTNTISMVIIGYSFPYFNRRIDRIIIRNMTKLRSVYIQAPEDDAVDYIDRFRAIRPDVDNLQTVPIKDVRQFFFPPEL